MTGRGGPAGSGRSEGARWLSAIVIAVGGLLLPVVLGGIIALAAPFWVVVCVVCAIIVAIFMRGAFLAFREKKGELGL